MQNELKQTPKTPVNAVIKLEIVNDFDKNSLSRGPEAQIPEDSDDTVYTAYEQYMEMYHESISGGCDK